MKLLTARQVAQVFNIPRLRVYELARMNALPGIVRLGERQLRFDESALRDFIQRGGVREVQASDAN